MYIILMFLIFYYDKFLSSIENYGTANSKLNVIIDNALNSKPLSLHGRLSPVTKQIKQLELLTNLTLQLYNRQTTSRTSLRTFFIKTLVHQKFFEENSPCCQQWVMDHFDEDADFIQRNIKRSIKANRYLFSDEKLYPSKALIEHIQGIYEDSGVSFIETNNRYGINITPFKVLQFLIDYCRISLAKKDQETLLQQAIQLTLWENLFYKKKKSLSTGHIAQRLNISKSTLSTALSRLLGQGILKTKQDCSDARITFWILNPENQSLREKYHVIQDYLCYDQ